MWEVSGVTCLQLDDVFCFSSEGMQNNASNNTKQELKQKEIHNGVEENVALFWIISFQNSLFFFEDNPKLIELCPK